MVVYYLVFFRDSDVRKREGIEKRKLATEIMGKNIRKQGK
jgi:hypothetical protein